MVGLMTPEISDSSFCMSASAARGRPQLATYRKQESRSAGDPVRGSPAGSSRQDAPDPLRRVRRDRWQDSVSEWSETRNKSRRRTEVGREEVGSSLRGLDPASAEGQSDRPSAACLARLMLSQGRLEADAPVDELRRHRADALRSKSRTGERERRWTTVRRGEGKPAGRASRLVASAAATKSADASAPEPRPAASS